MVNKILFLLLGLVHRSVRVNSLAQRDYSSSQGRQHECVVGVNAKAGSVLLFSLVIMGMVTVLTQQLVKSVAVGHMFTRAMVAREQAEMLALGGVRVAIAQLARSMAPEQEKGKKTDKNAQPKFSFKNYITHVLPYLERWQEFELKEEIDRIDGTLKVSISCEQGKLAINKLFDELKREIKPVAKELLKAYGIKKKLAAGSLPTKLGAFLKKRTHQVNEISSLVPLAKETHLPLFYTPPAMPAKKGAPAGNSDIAYQNLFTTWSKQAELNPLVLTDAMCAVLKIRRPLATDPARRKDRYKQLAEQYEKIKSKKGDEMWKSFQTLYDAKPKVSKEVMGLFSPVIEPRFHSVLSCATVGGVTQQLVAIIEQTAPKKPQQQQKQRSARGAAKQKPIAPHTLYKVRRLYWV